MAYKHLCQDRELLSINITSYAVAPGQQCEAQHSVAEAQHHTKHVQKADHFRGHCTDQHCTDYEP